MTLAIASLMCVQLSNGMSHNPSLSQSWPEVPNPVSDTNLKTSASDSDLLKYAAISSKPLLGNDVSEFGAHSIDLLNMFGQEASDALILYKLGLMQERVSSDRISELRADYADVVDGYKDLHETGLHSLLKKPEEEYVLIDNNIFFSHRAFSIYVKQMKRLDDLCFSRAGQ